MPKVSIIVPIFNTEKYLKRCLDCLINQTLRDIEIICIDDGSTDNSASILDEYAQKDTRIKLLKQKNLRQGAARNNGVNIATGDYIGYVDSDDWVDLDFYEKLYNTANEYDADIALATNIRIHPKCSKKRLNIRKTAEYTTLQEKFDICKQWKNECPTNKIYRKKMLTKNQIIWPEGIYCEDKIYTAKAVFYSNKIVTVPNTHYYYFDNPTSTVNTKHRGTDKNARHNARRSVIKFLREQNANLKDKQFWALVKEYRIFNIPLWRYKESLYTEAFFLFGKIKLWEKKLK